MHASGIQRIAERTHDVLLAHQFGESARTPLACENLIRHADDHKDEALIVPTRRRNSQPRDGNVETPLDASSWTIQMKICVNHARCFRALATSLMKFHVAQIRGKSHLQSRIDVAWHDMGMAFAFLKSCLRRKTKHPVPVSEGGECLPRKHSRDVEARDLIEAMASNTQSKAHKKEATSASHTPAPESLATVASFRTWRGLQAIVAREPTEVTIEKRRADHR